MLPAFALVVPITAAAVLVGIGDRLPRRARDAFAIGAALGAALGTSSIAFLYGAFFFEFLVRNV